jgi:phosphoserine phosphatase RsbU/P
MHVHYLGRTAIMKHGFRRAEGLSVLLNLASRITASRIAAGLALTLAFFASATPQVSAQTSAPATPHSAAKSNAAKPDPPAAVESVTFDATAEGAPIALDHDWRLGIAPGDAPAQPSFDDSKWATRDAKGAVADVDDSAAEAEKERRGKHLPPTHTFAWFRIHVLLPPRHGPLVVLVKLPVTRPNPFSVGTTTLGMDLFANGQQITPEGSHNLTPEGYFQISRVYPLQIPDSETTLTLAIRIPYVPLGLGAYTGFFVDRTFLLGDRDDLRSHLELWKHAVLFERIPTLVDSGIKILLGLFLLTLFWTQRDHPEYLWLGLHLIFVAPLAFIELGGSLGRIEKMLLGAVAMQLLLISAYFYFEFLIAFLSLRRRWYIRVMRYTAPVLLTFGPLLLLLRSENKAVAIALAISVFFDLFWIAAWLLFVGLTLSIAAMRRNYEAALLLLPLLLSVVGMAELISTASSARWFGASMQSPLTFKFGPIPIHFSAIADFAGIFVVILIVFGRFLRIHRERERASSELAAARSVQELMISRESPQTPGFHVDTVYTPATEVGGDFFHIEATGDSGLLVVIGDVAGHGLQAAMNVSMLMGALRQSTEITPGALLASLNQVLVGSSSFTTCEVAHFGANGELVIASAGHPPPYLNSQEILLPGGLPLGVIADAKYEETRLYLHPGDRLLMMSDGVAEARKANGELFGFDRVRNLSNQSAFFIADAAKEFGQEDDITVLTVRRLAQAIAA